jgi:hypothetical protein
MPVRNGEDVRIVWLMRAMARRMDLFRARWFQSDDLPNPVSYI